MSKQVVLRLASISLILFSLDQARASSLIFDGIEFPDGASSFADQVIRYDPLFSGGPPPTQPNATDPNTALGVPLEGGVVSLGSGGLIELQFIDNRLTNSGDGGPDLHIFEVGPDVEDTFVAIRPVGMTMLLLEDLFSLLDSDADGYFEVGKVFGSTSSIDIDEVFPGFGPSELVFDAVQLIDDPNEGLLTGGTIGADIDAVGAIHTEGIVLEGDLNLDGFVGIADLNLVLSNWNQNVPPADPAADPSGNGFVGITDLNFVLGNWNTGAPPVEASSVVPEPGTLILLGLGGIYLGARNRSQR
jgi:PEP-CTERM motif